MCVCVCVFFYIFYFSFFIYYRYFIFFYFYIFIILNIYFEFWFYRKDTRELRALHEQLFSVLNKISNSLGTQGSWYEMSVGTIY